VHWCFRFLLEAQSCVITTQGVSTPPRFELIGRFASRPFLPIRPYFIPITQSDNRTRKRRHSTKLCFCNSPPDQQFPVLTIHTVNASGIPNASGFNRSIEEVTRGRIGVFVLSMKPQIPLATTFVKLPRNWGHEFYVNHIDNDL
jgi:hypothetical protein